MCTNEIKNHCDEQRFFIYNKTLCILGVDKEYRSLGVGKQLLEKNKEYSKNNKLALIKVKVYGVSVEMRNLLENNGYKIIKTEKSEKAEKYDVYYFALQV